MFTKYPGYFVLYYFWWHGCCLIVPCFSFKVSDECFRYHFTPGRSAGYCDQRVCMSVCPLGYFKSHLSKLHEIFLLYMLSVVVARFCSDDSAVRYALPALWMTSWDMSYRARLTGLQPRDVSQREPNAERGSFSASASPLPDIIGRKHHHTQRSLAVEANNALCSGAKSGGILDFLVSCVIDIESTAWLFCMFCTARKTKLFTELKRRADKKREQMRMRWGLSFIEGMSKYAR